MTSDAAHGSTHLSPGAISPLPALAGDPATADLGCLEWLDPLVADARVVAVGESSHYNAESYRLRHLVLRYLVERHGFTAYATESGFAEGWSVDAWLARRVDDDSTGAVLARGMTSLMGMWTEQRDLLEWLRATGSGVRFYGVDTPGSNVSLLPALDLVADYLAAHDPGLPVDPALRFRAEVGAATSVFAAQTAVAEYVAPSKQERDELTAGLALLLVRLRAHRPLDGGDDTAFERARRALESAIALDAFRRDMTVNVRDLAQADTVEWILQREQRVVFTAHNGHVQRWPAEFPGVLPASTTAGQHLHERLGRGYRVIGVTNGTGQTLTAGSDYFQGRFFEPLPAPPAGTLDAVLAATHDAPFGVDLHRLDDRDRAVLAVVRDQRSGGFRCPIDTLTAYDALVHLPTVSPAHPDPAAVAAAPPEVAEAFRRWSAGS